MHLNFKWVEKQRLLILRSPVSRVAPRTHDERDMIVEGRIRNHKKNINPGIESGHFHAIEICLGVEQHPILANR